MTKRASKIKVGLVQINNSFSNQNYFPLSIGILQAYAQRHLKQPDQYEFLLPIYCRVPVDVAMQQLTGARVVFFSTYVWNFRISLEVAKKIKKTQPETTIVFGGPHVPNHADAFLAQHPFIDIACHGEGERVAVAVLEKGIAGKWGEVPSISYLNSKGKLVQNPPSGRIQDMATIPSPYLDGVFDPLIKAYPNENWVALWETNRGCPFSCTFCDWGSATQSKVFKFEMDKIYKEVDWFADHKIEFVFCADANFGILPRDLDIAQYVAESKKKKGYPQALSVQNTKNATERAYQVQKTLSDSGLNKGVTVALQSVDPETLKTIKRANISTESYQELQRRFTRDRVVTYSDIILGLPGETYEAFADGVSKVIDNGQHNRIQFNNLSILPNAEMGDPEYQRKHGMEYVESKIVNIHGSLSEDKEAISETQQLVIATKAMPRADWAKTRVFGWMTALLHFNKVFQIPLVLIHEICAVPYRELVEIFSEGSLDSFPVLSEIRSFFHGRAKEIQNGGTEFCRAEKWLNIYWPDDEYIFIKLCVENKLDAFYQEAEAALTKFLKDKFLEVPAGLLRDATELNKGLIKKPFQTRDLEIKTHYNILEFYRSVLVGAPAALAEESCSYHVDRTSETWSAWDDWFREVVWYGNKKGAYLYAANFPKPQAEKCA
jgi:radical SAM superfamily enzyme YgiQ (UPF0313 family)